jgi:glutathione S-transferase
MPRTNQETAALIKLHGFPVSNYANMVHLALLEKGVPFEYVLAIPDQSPGFLARSPRGKVPVLETPQGFINEASVILEYLEETSTEKPLLPAEPHERAYVRSLMKEIELYIELPARSCFAEAFFGGTVSQSIKAKARDELVAGFATLRRHAKFAPFVAGESFTLADVVFLYSADLGAAVSKTLFGVDPLADWPAAGALLRQLAENPNVQTIARNREAARPAFIAAVKARLAAAVAAAAAAPKAAT